MILLLCICSVLVAFASGEQSPIVNITQGTVIGSVATDGNYFEFYGIPYAGSTSGENRFKAPPAAPTFATPFEANIKNIKCVRPLGVGFEGVEDCLVANIFTPTLDNTAQLPVMVWIKGKEFDRVNVPELSFRNFVEKKVIIVSLNYRESIFGFLCLGTETAPGNAGLKDIIAGLKWIKANIAQFGGNPEDITLFGHGSGAAAVDLVTMSPMATGLVQKAIAQSGSAFAPWAVTRDNLKPAILVAETLGHQVISTRQLSDIFTKEHVSTLMDTINILELTDNSLVFAPCVERPELKTVEPFLTKTPFQILRHREFLPIPIIFGFVDNEGTIRAKEALESNWIEKMEISFADFIQSDLKFETDTEKLAMVQRLRDFYFDEDQIDILNFIEYHGDTMILISTIREASFRMLYSQTPVYVYQFSYSGKLGEPFKGPIPVESAAHSEELAYLFSNTSVEGTSKRDYRIRDLLVERWTNFAKTGNPTSAISQVTWWPCTVNTMNSLRFLNNTEISEDETLEIIVVNPYREKSNFWAYVYGFHFLDAESNWVISPEDEITTTESSTEAGDPNSASNAVANTFLTSTLFALLSHFHSS
ncbi:hypothetical protein PYW08_007226 [Mythimna loreyi]|uniref:Uncharacterized protein n=1 Tax=Mythimna loreyi TaxID=667449 RepID=A0ACC2R9U6_9NEOP|nr:hypothetical protein PYW08_007226 [Mythimna loreyi]